MRGFGAAIFGAVALAVTVAGSAWAAPCRLLPEDFKQLGKSKSGVSSEEKLDELPAAEKSRLCKTREALRKLKEGQSIPDVLGNDNPYLGPGDRFKIKTIRILAKVDDTKNA